MSRSTVNKGATALITGATALITGASSGIGKELARIHAAQGGNLVIVARRKEKLEELKTEIETNFKVKVTIIVKDLSKTEAAQELYDEVKKAGIKIDYLINNAGYGLRGKFHELTLQKQLDMINLNVISLTSLTHLFLQDFIKRNSGKILNVSSTASLMPGPLQAIYYATKSYVQFFSNALWEELKDTNITVTNLMPGATETEFAKTSGMDKTGLFQNAFSANGVAKAGYEAMLKGELDIVSGITGSQKLMFKMIPFIPKKILLTQIRKMQEV